MSQFIIAAVFLLGGIATFESGPFILGVIVAGAIVGYVWWQRRKLRYVVPDRRMLKVTGGGSRSTNEAWMTDIRGLQTGASLLERLLGHGHITVSTDIMTTANVPILGLFISLVGQQGMSFNGIGNYQEIADVIRERQNDVKGQ